MQILRTARLVLRPVVASDIDVVAAMNADERVMEIMGGAKTRQQTAEWLDGLVAHWEKHGYGRFFVEREGELVAVVGLSRTDYDAGILPAIEVAWRAPFAQWGNGYVTEAARAAIDDAFERIGLHEIIAGTVPTNERSLSVMKRLGMSRTPEHDFDYPRFPEGHALRRHVVYRLTHEQWSAVTSP